MEKIRSETHFYFKLYWDILKTPYILIMILFGKKEVSELFKPFKDIFEFIFEAKFTITIIILNILIYISSFFISPRTFEVLISFPGDMLSVKAYTLITSGFLHASPVHLWGNIVAIFIFGRIVEKNIGSFKTGLIYFASLVISNVFSSSIYLFVLKQNIGGIGASGALMGLVSTAILLDPFYLVYELGFPMPVMVMGWLTVFADVSGVINPQQYGIGHFAHLGGFLSIALIMYFMDNEDKEKLHKGLIINIVSIIILVIGYIYLKVYYL